MTDLFRLGDFSLASGARSPWKIDCDALTDVDLDTLAALAVSRLPFQFTRVEGVPRGGLRFAEALRRRAVASTAPLVLLVDDTWTTGGSMRRLQTSFGLDAQPLGVKVRGLVIFARGPVPSWVTAIFTTCRVMW